MSKEDFEQAKKKLANLKLEQLKLPSEAKANKIKNEEKSRAYDNYETASSILTSVLTLMESRRKERKGGKI